VFNRGLSRFWMQNVPIAGSRYVHPTTPEGTDGKPKTDVEVTT
jgi:hypothetical protein